MGEALIAPFLETLNQIGRDYKTNPRFPLQARLLANLSANYANQRKSSFSSSEASIAETECQQALKTLVQDPRNFNAARDLGEAAEQGNLPAVKAFLAAGADAAVNQQLPDGRTALFRAAYMGFGEVVGALILSGADFRPEYSGWTPLHVAVQRCSLETARMLLQGGADPNINVGGWTPLHIAARWGLCEITQKLIFFGADLNFAGDSLGLWTPLNIAAHWNMLDVVKILKHAGAKEIVRKGGVPIVSTKSSGVSSASSRDFSSISSGEGHKKVPQYCPKHMAEAYRSQYDQ